MKLYIVRHPETLHNKNNKITGWEKTKYSAKGKRQFNRILKFFKGCKYNIYSSDLPRASNLAERIAKENKSSLVITDLLRERNFRESKPKDSFESKQSFSRRVEKFLKEYDISDSIILTHSGVSEVLVKSIIGLKYVPMLNCPRDNIFLIEKDIKGKKLNIIEV